MTKNMNVFATLVDSLYAVGIKYIGKRTLHCTTHDQSRHYVVRRKKREDKDDLNQRTIPLSPRDQNVALCVIH